jgi:hypothetical protein
MSDQIMNSIVVKDAPDPTDEALDALTGSGFEDEEPEPDFDERI